MKMHSKSSFLILSTALLLLVTKEVTSDLMCYVCDHCTTVTANTPLLACDESFFNGGGTGLPSTMTTTVSTGSTTDEDPTTMAPTIMTPTTMAPTTMVPTTVPTTVSTTVPTPGPTTVSTTISTTESTTTESSTVETTTDPTTTGSTEPKPPSPPTVGPVETSTALPTPPTQGTVMPIIEIVTQGTTGQNETVANATIRNYMSSTSFRGRQERAAVTSMADAFTYHCYSVRFTSNKTVNTERGCARVSTEESVCQQLQDGISNDTSVSKCKFCETNRCNSSSTLGVSIFAVIIGLVASLVKRS